MWDRRRAEPRRPVRSAGKYEYGWGRPSVQNDVSRKATRRSPVRDRSRALPVGLTVVRTDSEASEASEARQDVPKDSHRAREAPAEASKEPQLVASLANPRPEARPAMPAVEECRFPAVSPAPGWRWRWRKLVQRGNSCRRLERTRSRLALDRGRPSRRFGPRMRSGRRRGDPVRDR